LNGVFSASRNRKSRDKRNENCNKDFCPQNKKVSIAASRQTSGSNNGDFSKANLLKKKTRTEKDENIVARTS
jgi:hypothetical protein